MKVKDLGEPVDVNSLPTEDLLANTIYANSEDADTPFVMKKDEQLNINENYNPVSGKNVNLTIEDKDDIFDEEEEVASPNVRRKVTNKEATSQLKKFRELFGLKRIDIKYHTITRKDENGDDFTMTFGFRALNYEDWQWLLAKIANIENINADTVNTSSTIDISNYRLAVVAISLCTLNEGHIKETSRGMPIWKVMGIEVNNKDYIKDPHFPYVTIRHEAADLLYEEIKSTLFDVVDDLYKAYNTLVESKLNDYFINQEGEENVPLS